jgi:large subunit ribosomal protein L30
MGLKVTLIKSFSGSSERQLGTISGLGLKKFGDVRILKDSPEIRGMVKKVAHLVHAEVVKQDPKPNKRLKARKIRVRDLARAEEAKPAATKVASKKQ